MNRSGTATLPLHYGRASGWLFQRMKILSREIVVAIVSEFGTADFLKKLSDPYWFQCFGCVLGFDWHSSGLTTTVTGAIKDGLKGVESEIGLLVAGGKGRASRKTIGELKEAGYRYGINADSLVYASRMAAKVDNSAVQDGFQLYHHTFFFNMEGQWAVIQQGMSVQQRLARRYHWLGETIDSFVIEPHSAICSERKAQVLNLIHRDSADAKSLIAALSRRQAEKNIDELKRLTAGEPPCLNSEAFSIHGGDVLKSLRLPSRHYMLASDINPERLNKIFLKTYEHCPTDFEQLLGIEGVGPKTIRALSLISDLIYGVSPSFSDPARYSFAIGGKDGIPYPVDIGTYDKTIEVMKRAIERAKICNRDKMDAVRRIMEYINSLI